MVTRESQSQFKPFSGIKPPVFLSRRSNSSNGSSSTTVSPNPSSPPSKIDHPERSATPKPEEKKDSFHRTQEKKRPNDQNLALSAGTADRVSLGASHNLTDDATPGSVDGSPADDTWEGFGLKKPLPALASTSRHFNSNELVDDEDDALSASSSLPFLVDEPSDEEGSRTSPVPWIGNVGNGLFQTSNIWSTSSDSTSTVASSDTDDSSWMLPHPLDPKSVPCSYYVSSGGLSDPDKVSSLGIDEDKELSGPLATHEELVKALEIPYPIKLITPQGAQPAQSAQEAAKKLKTAKVVALGDLHGSYRKLIETLVAADMIRMPMAAAERFKELAGHSWNYSARPSRLQDLDFELQPVFSTLEWTGGDRKFILIGDVISDRGPFDQSTMELIETLKRQLNKDDKKRIVQIVGNHDHNVLRSGKLGYSAINEGQTNSLIKAKLIAEAMDPENGLTQLNEQYAAYLMQSELMHFDSESKTLYVHAPIHKENVEQLIALLQKQNEEAAQAAGSVGMAADYNRVKDYDEMNTEEDLQQFIAIANHGYRNYVRNVLRTGQLCPDIEAVLCNDVWGRQGFLWRRSMLDQEVDLPFKQCGVKRLVHGHDLLSKESPFSIDKKPNSEYSVVNLDQWVRKCDVQEMLSSQSNYEEFLRKHRVRENHLDESRLYIE